MIPFIIKSSVSLAFLYGFYHIFLRNTRMFYFNRFYLLFALVFSFVIPFITVRINIDLPVNQAFYKLTTSTGNLKVEKVLNKQQGSLLTSQNILILFYFVIATTLFLRFVINISRIKRTIKKYLVADKSIPNIVLIENQILPHSFFKYIFLNRYDFENGKIDKSLIEHETVHCKQFHSIDILFVELLRIVFWFNPLLLFYRKAIQLNHEFLADDKVLMHCEIQDYINTLTQFSFRNTSTYLASNLNYSLTKKRLIMMTQNNSLRKAIFLKIASIPAFLILAISLTLAQGNKSGKSDFKVESEWWYPFIEKHGFNFDKNNSNTKGGFELDRSNIKTMIMITADKKINNLCENVKVAFFEGDTAIFIVEAPMAILDAERMYYEFENGKTFHYYKNGDYEKGEFINIKINKSFQKNNKNIGAEEDESFQKTLDDERQAAEEEQTDFQKKLAEEQKAAVIDQRFAAEEQKKLAEKQLKLAEEQKAATEDQKAFLEGKIRSK